MASYYDPEKKCRTGTMDEAQFRAESGEMSATFFAALMASWTRAGGELKWGAGGVSLRGKVDGRDLAVCFLAPQFAGKKDRIELACATLAKNMEPRRLEQLQLALRSAAGKQVLGTSMISVVDPGLLQQEGQDALAKAFLDLI